MSGRGRAPRRFIEDGRGHPDARVVEDRRGHTDARIVEDRRGHAAIRVVEDRRGHPGIRVVEADRRGHPGIGMVEEFRRGHPGVGMVEEVRRGIRVVEDRRGQPAIRLVQDHRGHPGIHEGPSVRVAARPHPAVLEEEIEMQEVELRRLMADHRVLADEHVVLQRELQAGKDEIRQLNMIISDISAKKEAYISDLVDKRRKLETELRANEPLRDEIVQLRVEIEKLIAVRKELSTKAASLVQELSREKSSTQQIPMLAAEIDGLRQELIHARTTCDLEQKGNFELVEQMKAMEKSMMSMAQEIEQMRAESANFEARPWGTGGAYGMKRKLGSPDVTFPTSYVDNHKIHVGVSEIGSSHPPESLWGSYDENRLQYR